MATLHPMANRHFGKFADVWKHLVLDEVLENTKPARYAETHAGSGAYAMVHDAERRYGVLGFFEDLSSSKALSTAAFSHVTSAFVKGQPSLYPGSALQAMTLLGDQCAYLLCDMDPVSVDDLRAWSHRLNLSHCEVAQRDGMAAVREWLGDPSTTVVHIDPFEPFTREEGGLSAIEMAAEVADAGHALVYWYGFDNPKQRSWAMDEIRTLTSASLWCGDFMVTSSTHKPATDGDLGEATTPGTGCGVVLANVASPLMDRCLYLAHALVDAYDGKALPTGEPGHLDLAITTTP
jgi:23S rRNA A2030 N6-methylase RlmJ